jgi:hypothetical protein
MLPPSEWRSGSNRISWGSRHDVFQFGIGSRLGISDVCALITNSTLQESDKSEWVPPEQEVKLVLVGLSSITDSVLPRSEWVPPEQEVKLILVNLFKAIPQVKSICAQFGAEEIIIWTLLESYDREAREKVYEKELEVCAMLRLYDFDFRVTSIDLVSPDELIRSGSHEIYRRQ